MKNSNNGKSESGLQEEFFLVETRAEELRPFVQGGQVALGVQDVVFFGDTEATCFGAWLVDTGPPQKLPLNHGLQPLVLEGPHVPGQPGVLPLGRMLEVRLVVAQSGLEGGVAHAHVPLLSPADGRDISLVHNIVIFTSCPVHWAVVDPSPAITV